MTLQEAMNTITWRTKQFPKEEFAVVRENREEAIPLLREALKKAVTEGDDLEEGYQLHFYALFFLGEFQDQESFDMIMDLILLPPDTLDYLISDAITSGLDNIVYNTYNGNLNKLKQVILNKDADEYARSACMDVLCQFYLDGTLEKEELQSFLRQIIYDSDDIGEGFYSFIAINITRCHMVDMLPDIRQMFSDERIDLSVGGDYCDYVDDMFQYDDYEKTFCSSPMSADELESWAMFEHERPERKDLTEKEYEKLLKKATQTPPVSAGKKIGRNDPCPCGSGKKYKFCCLNKKSQTDKLDKIESPQERQKWLEDYPKTGIKKEEGKIYLDEFYEQDAIEIDRIVYLALHHRARPMWVREEKEKGNLRKGLYLMEAFDRFQAKTQKEGILTFEEYDEKYSIHYNCEEWLNPLLRFLQEKGSRAACDTVNQCIIAMS